MSSDEQIDQFEDDLCTIERASDFKSIKNKQTTADTSSTDALTDAKNIESSSQLIKQSNVEFNQEFDKVNRGLDQKVDQELNRELNQESNQELNRELNQESNQVFNQDLNTQLEQQSTNQLLVQDDNSSTSSSHPPTDVLGEKWFKPNYVVAVLPSELEVDDYSVYYVIKAISIGKTDESKSDSKTKLNKPVQEMIVKRDFDDFLYLNHVLVNSAYPGYIHINIRITIY